MLALIRVIRAIRGHSASSSFVIFAQVSEGVPKFKEASRKGAKESTELLFPLRLCVFA